MHVYKLAGDRARTWNLSARPLGKLLHSTSIAEGVLPDKSKSPALASVDPFRV